MTDVQYLITVAGGVSVLLGLFVIKYKYKQDKLNIGDLKKEDEERDFRIKANSDELVKHSKKIAKLEIMIDQILEGQREHKLDIKELKTGFGELRITVLESIKR